MSSNYRTFCSLKTLYVLAYLISKKNLIKLIINKPFKYIPTNELPTVQYFYRFNFFN